MSTFAESLGASALVTGLAVGMYSFSNTFGNIFSGFWTDKKGPFHVLVTGLLLTGGALFLYGWINDAIALLFIRFIHGLVAGFIVPAAFTYLANETAQEKRGKGSAISGAFVGIAAIIGPAFSGILASRMSVPLVFNFTGLCMLVLGVIALFVLRNQERISSRKKVPTEVPIRAFFRNSGTIKAFMGAFFLMFSQGAIAYLLPLHVQSLGYDSKMSGMLLSTFGVVAVLVFVLPTNKIFDLVRPQHTLAIGIGLMGLSQLLLSQSNNTFLLYLSLACYGVGFGFLFPSINSLLIDSTSIEVRGKAYGYFYAFFSLGVVVGSSILGWLPVNHTQGFLLTGLLLLTFAIISLVGRHRSTQLA